MMIQDINNQNHGTRSQDRSTLEPRTELDHQSREVNSKLKFGSLTSHLSFQHLRSTLSNHLAFIGPGIVASVAYLDPGNWATDIQAGSTYGYAHLFVILIAALMAILLQILSTRLGYVTGKDLAQQCRLHLYDRPTHKMLWRWCALYPLYLICEAGIIFTDLAELIGSAMAMKMLIPQLPLYAGVLLTSLDVFVVLIFFNTYPSSTNKTSTRIFELAISLLVLAVLISFIILLVKVSPQWGPVFHGFLPSSRMILNGGLYQAIGIVGATVMPHALFLGSRVAILDRVLWKKEDSEDKTIDDQPTHPPNAESTAGLDASHLQSCNLLPALQLPQPVVLGRHKREWSTHTDLIQHIRSHLGHASFDIAISLFTLALPVNAAILIVSAAAFYYTESEQLIVADLFSAHRLLAVKIGEASAYVFAIALLLSGQAASITVTLSGQIVSEGFLEWRTNPVVRRMVTRLIGIVPAAAVAGAVGIKGMDNLLVGSQVALSLVLPFVIVPLLVFTSDQQTMSVIVPTESASSLPSLNKTGTLIEPDSPGIGPSTTCRMLNPTTAKTMSPTKEEEIHCFGNGRLVWSLTLIIILIVCGANVYGIVQLIRGEE